MSQQRPGVHTRLYYSRKIGIFFTNSRFMKSLSESPVDDALAQNSRSGKRIGATSDQMKRPAVAQLVTTRTHTEGHPTSTSLPLSPTEVDQPVKSIAEYMLAREKMMWKNAYEYDTGFLFSFSSFSSALPSNGSRGFSEHFQ